MIEKSKGKYLLAGLITIGLIIGIIGKIRSGSGIKDIDKKTQTEEIYGTEVTDQYKIARDGFKVLESHGDNIYGTIEGNRLYRTSGINSDRYLIHEFESETKIVSMQSLKNGNILVCTSEDRWSDKPNGKIYLSKDGSDDFIAVLDLEIGDAYHWNYADDDDGYVFISEYGYKGEDNNARRIYRSKDFGENFEVVYNPPTEEGYHNHKIHIDVNDKNKIYQVIGDDNKRLLISEDRGDSWRSLDWGNYHPTSIVDVGDYLLMGLDGVPYSGVVKFDKEEETISESLRLYRPDGGSAYTMIEKNGKIYVGFMSYASTNSWDGTIYSTEDGGENWKKDYSFDKLNRECGVGFYKFVGQDNKLYIDIGLPYIEDREIKSYLGTLELDFKE